MDFNFSGAFSGLLPSFIKLLPIILIIIVVIIFISLIKKKVKVKWRTFTKKGFRPERGNFGLYVYCGKQGTGKTYSVVEYLLDNKDNIAIYCNIGGITGIDYVHFTGFDGLLDLKNKLDNNTLDYDKDKQLVFVYDEVFTELQKGSKLSKDVLDFLCQMRKRKIIFLTTAQEWAEIPLSFRRFCRYEIDCKMRPFLWTGFLIKTFKDAENMKWSNEEQEHIAPLVETTVTHTRKYIADSYDTFLRISSIVDFSTGASATHQGEKKDVVIEKKVLEIDPDFIDLIE